MLEPITSADWRKRGGADAVSLGGQPLSSMLCLSKGEKMRFAHTNIAAKNWKSLSEFYIKVFHCKIKPPERKLSGAWLDQATGLQAAILGEITLPNMSLVCDSSYLAVPQLCVIPITFKGSI
ncbi:MAG: hypothetical protein WBI57_08485 [Desulfobacterales bacterium]